MQASKGIKLDPRIETINILEIVSLPIQVMKDMQSRIAVNLLPLPAAVCSHIMTDKQWLQENLFCLISNAVKYSGEGTINVGISLVKFSQLPEGARRVGLSKSGISSRVLEPHREETDGDEGFSANTERKHPKVGATARRSFSLFNQPRIQNIKVHDSHDTLNSESAVAAAEQNVKSKDVLLFEVEDTGIGLSDEMMKNLFTPFKQVLNFNYTLFLFHSNC